MQIIRRYPLSLEAPTTINLPAGSIVRDVRTDNLGNAAIWIQIEAKSRNRELRTFTVFAREKEIPAAAVYCGSGVRSGGEIAFVFEIPKEQP